MFWFLYKTFPEKFLIPERTEWDVIMKATNKMQLYRLTYYS